MKLLTELATKLVTAKICNEIDEDIFTDFRPADPDEVVSLNEYKGTSPARFTNMSVRSVQVYVRSRKNMVAKEKIWQIYDLLHSLDCIITLDKKISLINIRHTPIKIGVDEKNRYEWVMNLGITYDNTK